MSVFGNTALLPSKQNKDGSVKEIKKKEVSKNTTRYYSDSSSINVSSFSDYSYGSDDCSSSSDSSSCD
jgi:hypothetical protein